MSLVPEQSAFLLQVAELIQKAAEMGFVVSGGELYRTPEQQALHIKNGRSATMNSQHLKRLAVDLNFFKTTPEGKLKLTYEHEDLRPLGEFWEELDPANRWGGNWSTFKDTPHFERREGRSRPASVRTGSAPVVATATAAAVAGTASRRGVGLIQAAVGARCRNARDDVESVQRLLNLSAGKGRFEIDEGALKPDGAFGRKTLTATMAFQRAVLGEQEPSGQVDPVSPTMTSLCEVLPGDVDTALLGLAYLRADEADVQELCPGIQKTMANRNIDTPLRCAHFLAQIGHESGELRFREEIASGQAYEGRVNLGNTVAGDGRRFKGRGLIQLTGRANYTQYGRAIDREAELLQHPELVASEVDLCVDVAGWYWAKHGLNALADADDLTTITRRINGGLNGLDDRRRLLKRAKSLLGV